MLKTMSMTENELEAFAGHVSAFWHPHEEIDPMKDVAAYVLDLLQQGYRVPKLLIRLKAARELAGPGSRHGDMITLFSQAIRLTKNTEAWRRFHQGES